MAPAIEAVKVPSPVRAGSGNASRFPRPCATVPCRLAGPGSTKGQRPTRRARSARRGRGGRWPGALAPGWSSGSVALWQGRWPLPWKRGHCFLRPRGTLPPGPSPPAPTAGQRPPVAGRALAGGFGPRQAKDQRGAVAGAMAPAGIRRTRAGARISRLAVSQPLRPGLFRLPAKLRQDFQTPHHNGRRFGRGLSGAWRLASPKSSPCMLPPAQAARQADRGCATGF